MSSEDRYAIVELMGHRRFGAKIYAVDQFGCTMMRAEVPAPTPFVQDVHPQAFYAITTCTEEQAKAASRFAISPAEEEPDDDNPFVSTRDPDDFERSSDDDIPL